MRLLMVLAHPLADSYAASVARTARDALEANGHSVDLLDLYAEGFDPRLSESERRGYFDIPYDTRDLDNIVSRLQAAEGLILVFPQWWFNFPAVMKGFFDRAFAPGVAFDHDKAGGRIVPKLTNIRLFWALTTTGSPHTSSKRPSRKTRCRSAPSPGAGRRARVVYAGSSTGLVHSSS